MTNKIFLSESTEAIVTVKQQTKPSEAGACPSSKPVFCPEESQLRELLITSVTSVMGLYIFSWKRKKKICQNIERLWCHVILASVLPFTSATGTGGSVLFPAPLHKLITQFKLKEWLLCTSCTTSVRRAPGLRH